MVFSRSKESRPRGPGFDFTPEGHCLPLNTRTLNHGNPAAGRIGLAHLTTFSMKEQIGRVL